MKSRSHKQNRAGGVYIAVLGASLVVGLLGASALVGQRIENRTVTASSDIRQAQLNANSAIEMGLLVMKQESNWRSSRSNGPWFSSRDTGAGTCQLEVIDPHDGNLSNNPDDPVVMTGIGYRGNAQQRVKLTVEPLPEGAKQPSLRGCGGKCHQLARRYAPHRRANHCKPGHGNRVAGVRRRGSGDGQRLHILGHSDASRLRQAADDAQLVDRVRLLSRQRHEHPLLVRCRQRRQLGLSAMGHLKSTQPTGAAPRLGFPGLQPTSHDPAVGVLLAPTVYEYQTALPGKPGRFSGLNISSSRVNSTTCRLASQRHPCWADEM